MTESERDPIIERIALEARRPVTVDPDVKVRLMDAIRAEGAPGAGYDDDFAPARRGISLSRAGFAALAAGLVGVGILLGSTLLDFSRDSHPTGQSPIVAGNDPSRLPASSDTVMTFVFVSNNATQVSIVGDFNQWDAAATPMKRMPNSNAWTVTVSLPAGRHTYSFRAVGIDGEKWLADPNAPAAPDDGFGRASSVVLVGKSAS